MKSITITIGLVLLFAVAGICQDKGSITRENFRVKDCNIKSMTVKYDISTIFGEPLVKGSYKWEAGEDTDSDCLPYNFVVWLEYSYGDNRGYVRLDPVVPEAGKGYGYNVPGSPNWNKLFCSFRGPSRQECFGKSEAKSLYKAGSVTNFERSHK